jgi:hypothetical protein
MLTAVMLDVFGLSVAAPPKRLRHSVNRRCCGDLKRNGQNFNYRTTLFPAKLKLQQVFQNNRQLFP